MLYGRYLFFWAEAGKQNTRSCRAQELARSSAQENAWQKKAIVDTSDKFSQLKTGEGARDANEAIHRGG
jgi:hypothetical protein